MTKIYDDLILLDAEDDAAKDASRNGFLKTACDALDDFLEIALQAVYPNVCLLCGEPAATPKRNLLRIKTPVDALICNRCRSLLVAPTNAFCKRCGAPTRPGNASGLCERRCGANLAFDLVYPLNFYKGLTRSVVLRLKRESDPLLARMLGALCFEARRIQIERFRPDCVVAVPMNWRRRALRAGVNSPDSIAKEIALRLGVPALSKRIKRTRATAPQTAVDWERRASNVRGAFDVAKPFLPFFSRRDAVAPFANKRVALVDDAFTTGATANEVARVLKASGADAVLFLALARAGLGGARRENRSDRP